MMESMKKQYLKSGFWMRKENQDKKKWFMDNGSIFLKELIADCNVVRGKIEDKSYVIKRFSEDKITEHRVHKVYNDFVLCARMSNHSNFLKLLGFCLEFPFPVLVFEDAEHGVLNQRGGVTVNGEESLLPLNLRLKIVKEIANAVTYLHMAFPKIIIHRDIKPTHVFLDKNWTAKLSHLTYAILLEEGKSQIEAAEVVGTFGYVDPLYFATKVVSEYTDVYSFGVFLMAVMTSRSGLFAGSDEYILEFVKGLYETRRLNEVIDPVLMKDMTSGQNLQMERCMILALRCCEERHEDRPKMIQVAKELKRFETGEFRSLLGYD